MPESKISINVLGTSVTIAADEDQDYLDNLLEIYRGELEDTKNMTELSDALKVAVLTGFSLCDKIEKLKKEKDSKFKEAENLTLKLISRLDEALTGSEKKNAGEEYGILKLENTVKNYSWGSPLWIPRLLGKPNPEGAPWAELWMGVHHDSPSLIIGRDRKNIPLPDVIRCDPVYYLGKETFNDFNTLPFLFKVLAAKEPLSIQTHPNIEQARSGWERENRENIAINSSERCYKDPNHKPEIICALSPFTAMCGFRTISEITGLFDAFLFAAPGNIKSSLASLVTELRKPENPLMSFLHRLLNIETEIRGELTNYAKGIHTNIVNYPQFKKEWKLVSNLAELHPLDPAMLSPLYLNLIQLEVGEAINLPPGVLHSYVSGMGMELMANSDNVLRGGLTVKTINQDELFKTLRFTPYKPQILKAPQTPDSEQKDKKAPGLIYTYPGRTREFSLTFLCGGNALYKTSGPSIIFVSSGRLAVNSSKGLVTLTQGESAFIPAGESCLGLNLSGDYTAYAAATPEFL